MSPRAAAERSSTSIFVDRDRRRVRGRAASAVIWVCSLTLSFFVFTRTAFAHEKWFHKGPWEPANWRNVAQFPTAVLIAGVVVITILAALVRRRLARPNVFPGPVALGADADGITRFYALVPVILAIHVAVPLLVYGIQGHLFAPYLILPGVWQYWLGLIQVGAAIALFYGGLTRLAAIAVGVAWLIGIGVFGLEPMLDARFVLCAGSVELFIGLFVLFGLFPRLIILVVWLPFNLTLTIFGWSELIGHLPFCGAMALLLVWTPEEQDLWIKGLRAMPIRRADSSASV